MKKILAPLFAIAAIAAAAVSCEEKIGPEKETAVSVMEGFDEHNAVNAEVAEDSTGVKLLGMGVEFDPHFLAQNVTRNDGAIENDWNRYIVKRVNTMDIQRYRVSLYPHWWEPSEGVYTWDSPEMQSLCAVLDLAEENNTDVTLVLWGYLTKPFSVSDNRTMDRYYLCDSSEGWCVHTKDTDKAATNFVKLVEYLVKEKGYTCVKELTPYNEPNFSAATGHYEEFARNLDKRLKEAGIRDRISLNLSDNVSSNRSLLSSTASTLDDIADLYNSHYYAGGYNTKNSAIKSWETGNVRAVRNAGSKKPHFVGEFGSNETVGATRQKDINLYKRGVLLARTTSNMLNGGAAGLSYWILFDQYYAKNGSYNEMQQLGLWRYVYKVYQEAELDPALGKSDYTIRPQYYAYSLLTRFIRKGSYAYPIDFTSDYASGTATRAEDGKWTIFIANGDSKDLDFILTSRNEMIKGKKFDVYQYIENKLPIAAKQIEPSMVLKGSDENTLSLHIPSQTLLLLHQQ